MTCRFTMKTCVFQVLCLIILCGEKLALANESKLVIDNDAGGDDAMAIFIGLLYEKYHNGPKLISLTTGNGNTNEDNVCTNNQRILKVAKRQDVPIHRGAKKSMVITPLAGHYYGVDGLGDSDEVVGSLVAPQTQCAVEALLRLSKEYSDKLILVTIGSLTNVALAISLDPGFIGRLEHLYVGAGHIHDHQHTNPEFNAWMDVEGYRTVVKNASPDKVTLLPFSQVKFSLNFTKSWRQEVLGAIDTDIINAQNKYEKVSLQKEGRWTALDPALVSAALKPELVKEYKYSKNDIILCGEDRGKTLNTFVEKEDANVRLIYEMKDEEYKKFLLELFSADLPEQH